MSQALEVLFLCHGPEGSPAVDRAAAFACAWEGQVRAQVVPRAAGLLRAGGAFWRELERLRPRVVWVVDVSPAGVLAALAWARWGQRARVVVDTGDAVFALARAARLRGPVGLGLTWGLERLALGAADHVVTRGSAHAELLEARGIAASVVQDGVDTALFRPLDVPSLRADLAPGGELIVGFVGSLGWNARRSTCYGWELIEALAALRDVPVRGLVIGDGPGLPRLRARAADLGLSERIRFVGRVALADLPPLLCALDVALSTQSDDLVGQVRTTGKLPLYLACGRFVLATRVGEAARVMDPAQLLAFEGAHDPRYPARLAGRLRELLADRSALAAVRARNRALAEERFAYPVLAKRALKVLERVGLHG